MTKRRLTLLGASFAALVLIALAGTPASSLPVTDVFELARVAPKGTADTPTGGEPSIISAPDGTLYVSYPSSEYGMAFHLSANRGKKWIAGATAWPSTGDTTVNVDSTGAVYQSNLRRPPSTSSSPDDPSPLQIDVFKSLDKGKTWPQRGFAGSSDSATNSPFLVDRQWVDVYVPPGKTTNEARVYITYHDFVPGLMWVNASKDGGRTFTQAKTIMTSPEALANGFCNVIPGQLKVVQSGPRAGRVYIAWLAGSAATNVPTGCNYTMLATFGQVWIAYSDDEGETWTNTLVYDAGAIGHDAAGLFADLALDRAGNPYVTFALNDAELPHTGAEGDQWNVFVSASFDGGQTWNGASDGSGAPTKVTSDAGTHVFPAITAGDPGMVAVAYLGTESLIPQLPYGKPMIGGDPEAQWNVFVSRSLNLTSGTPTWTTTQVTTKPMHVGDVCTLGIFCIDELGSDRTLLDFIDIDGDPDGLVHVAYTDTEISDPGEIMVANQVAGASLRKPKTPKKASVLPKTLRPEPAAPEPRTVGDDLPGTGVGLEVPLVGILLLLVAVAVSRRLRGLHNPK